MAIYRIFKTRVFEPEAIAIMSAAYEDALRVLRLTDRADPITEVVAKKIIDVAELGERDPARICEAALKELGSLRSHLNRPAGGRSGRLTKHENVA
jgi:hypothetical protein